MNAFDRELYLNAWLDYFGVDSFEKIAATETFKRIVAQAGCKNPLFYFMDGAAKFLVIGEDGQTFGWTRPGVICNSHGTAFSAKSE